MCVDDTTVFGIDQAVHIRKSRTLLNCLMRHTLWLGPVPAKLDAVSIDSPGYMIYPNDFLVNAFKPISLNNPYLIGYQQGSINGSANFVSLLFQSLTNTGRSSRFCPTDPDDRCAKNFPSRRIKSPRSWFPFQLGENPSSALNPRVGYAGPHGNVHALHNDLSGRQIALHSAPLIRSPPQKPPIYL